MNPMALVRKKPAKPARPKTVRQAVVIAAPPDEVYGVLMNSKRHAKLIGSTARISPKVGGKFTAYDGWIQGKNLALVPGKKIVQLWRGDDWEKGAWSKLAITLSKTKTGTKLLMVHAGVPAEFAADIAKGWKDYYWEPLKKMFRH